MDKEEVLKGLQEAYESLEKLYDENLSRMGSLYQQIEAIKENNTNILNKMRDLVSKKEQVRNK